MLAGAALGCSVLTLQAQSPVVTGILDFVSPEDGTVRLRCDQLAMQPMVFVGMNAANIQSPDGGLLTVAHLSPGMSATFYFRRAGKKRWIISKVLVEEPAPYYENFEGYHSCDFPPTRVIGRLGMWRRAP